MVMIVQAPWAEAIAVDAQGQLTAVGSSASILRAAEEGTVLHNLAGAFVTPVSVL